MKKKKLEKRLEDKQTQFFNNRAKAVEAFDLETAHKEIRNEFEALIAAIPDIYDKRILDLGCGTGRLSFLLAQHAKEVVGLDISKDSITVANKTAKKYRIKNFKGVVGDFNNIQYKKHFDYIICLNLIHHVKDLELIIKNVNASLKKDGYFVIFEFNPLNLLFIPFLYRIGQLKIHLNKEYMRSNLFTLTRRIKQNAFRINKIDRHAFLPTSLYKYSPIFRQVNRYLNIIPLVNSFTAYHIIICSPLKPEK